MDHLRLGTRGSLLAMAQSRMVAAALKQLRPDVSVELVVINTRGDRNQTVPLQAVQDADFFSAELDEALLDGAVDFCVHSLKDLPLVRPDGIGRAALPRRENPRDVIVWRRDVPTRLAAGLPLRVGSSSARRQGNVADFLADALPASTQTPVITFVPLRGPVDARLARLRQASTDADALDGVVLALAGLNRLWNDPAGRAALDTLLQDVRWMVLPLTACPAAPGQGVLAVECRTGNDGLLGVLGGLHDPETAELVAAEDVPLTNLSRNDRPALGVTSIWHRELGPVCFLRGTTSSGVVERLHWRRPPVPEGGIGFDGGAWQRACTRETTGPLPALDNLLPGSGLFVASWQASQYHTLPAEARVWVSGVESWRRLAARGLWVEGCGDNLGFEHLRSTLECPVLGLPRLQDWTALTSRMALPGWRDSGVGRVLATYDIAPPANRSVLQGLRESAQQATHFYWSTPEQFHALRASLPASAHHACGVGKTLRDLRAAGIDAHPFPSGREWQRWLH